MGGLAASGIDRRVDEVRTLRIIIAALCLLLLGQTETVQFFVGDDGCYGDGTSWVVRSAINECEHGAGGWGDARMECYSDGAMYHACGVPIELYCCSADLDQDGDVDLEDFALFQREYD